METALGSGEVSPSAEQTIAASPVLKMLQEFSAMAERGELTGVLIGYVLKDGDAAVRSTPMTAGMMNHLSRMLDRKVDRMYDRAMALADGPVRSPTSPMRAQNPKAPAAMLPRKVRRQVAAAQKKVLKKAKKRATLSGPPLPAES